MQGCGLLWVAAWAAASTLHSRPPPVPCRVWREEFPFRAQLGRCGQRGERDSALGLRIRWSEVLSLLAPLRSPVSVATDQRAAAGGAQQDQSGRREWHLCCAQQVADGIGCSSLWLFEAGCFPWGSVHVGWAVGKGLPLSLACRVSSLLPLSPACRGLWDLLLRSD